MKALYEQNLFEYHSWSSMKQRCYNPNNGNFNRYGGAGIRICERWRTSFEVFLQDMGPKPQSNFHIHRINPDGDYCPENCIWLAPIEHSKQEHRPMIETKLTARQQEILEFLVSCSVCPSMREIAAYFSISSKCAFDHVNALEKKGAIMRNHRKARSITIL